MPHEFLFPRYMLQWYSLSSFIYELKILFFRLGIHFFLGFQKKSHLICSRKETKQFFRIYLSVHAKCFGQSVLSFFNKYPRLHLTSLQSIYVSFF